MSNRAYKSSPEVQAMFDRIAPRYDLMNRLMTFGQDMRWRRFLVRQLGQLHGARVLDVATGTGDIAFEVHHHFPSAEIIASDFAVAMMRMGQARRMGSRVDWAAGDAQRLPFPNESFDAITSGYLFRNVPDISVALGEQLRLLKSGGHMATLDTSPPPSNMLKPFILIHLKYVIPTLGKLITPDAEAYQYLPASTLRFKTPEDLAAMMRAAGFVKVGFRPFMFGTMAVHWGQKP